MYDCAKKAMKTSQTNMKRYYDKRRRDEELNVDEYVYVFNPGLRNAKLKPKWLGPYKITKISGTLYQIEIIKDGISRLQWLPRDRLKRCHQLRLGSTINHENAVEECDSENSGEMSDSSSSADESENEEIEDPVEGNLPYNLRSRPTPGVDRLMVSQISFI